MDGRIGEVILELSIVALGGCLPGISGVGRWEKGISGCAEAKRKERARWAGNGLASLEQRLQDEVVGAEDFAYYAKDCGLFL